MYIRSLSYINRELRKYFKANRFILAYLPVIKILISAIQIKNEKQIDVTESDFHLEDVLKVSH